MRIISYMWYVPLLWSFFFFFLNDTPTPEFSPLPLHAALPIGGAVKRARQSGDDFVTRGELRNCRLGREIQMDRGAPSQGAVRFHVPAVGADSALGRGTTDRKSTRLNSSHDQISYAVFCLKKKK